MNPARCAPASVAQALERAHIPAAVEGGDDDVQGVQRQHLPGARRRRGRGRPRQRVAEQGVHDQRHGLSQEGSIPLLLLPGGRGGGWGRAAHPPRNGLQGGVGVQGGTLVLRSPPLVRVLPPPLAVVVVLLPLVRGLGTRAGGRLVAGGARGFQTGLSRV